MKPGKTSASSKRVAPSLAHVNVAFHAAYDRSTTTFENEAPIFVLFADALVLRRGTRAETFRAVPVEFHALKSAVHTPVAAFTLLNEVNGRRCSANVIARLKKLRTWSAASIPKIDDAISTKLLIDTIAFLDRVLDERRVARKDLDAFARSCGEKIEALMDRAAKLELECLHSNVEKALSRLSAKERKTLQVVVAGHHQARDRSLGMQYFQKRLREKPGRDERVIFAEGADSVADALAVIGKKRLDRDLARSFFGDAKRMQRDLLGDAAKRILSASKPKPINRH